MKLLTQDLRQTLPELYEQDGKGKDAIVYAKFFLPSKEWTWHVLEGSVIKDDDGSVADFLFFGLVNGFEKEFGYFSLNELQAVKDPLGIGIERDIHWKPQPIGQIAPEMFKEEDC